MIASSQANQMPLSKKADAKNRSGGVMTTIYYLLIVVCLIQGWQLRDQYLINAEEGIGYALGIVGGVAMLLLLLYPLRKRFNSLRVLGPIKHIFRLHMVLGVLGPTLILFHSNFSLGAMNSNVALWCMLVVAVSGLVGRYIYSRIHNGLYGHKLTLKSLQDESKWQLGNIVNVLESFPDVERYLAAYEKSANSAAEGILSPIKIPLLGLRTLIAYRFILIRCRFRFARSVEDKKLRRFYYLQTKVNLRKYFRSARRVATFGFYTRLFSLWHVLHFPLFMMMLITGIVHVIAVHMY